MAARRTYAYSSFLEDGLFKWRLTCCSSISMRFSVNATEPTFQRSFPQDPGKFFTLFNIDIDADNLIIHASGTHSGLLDDDKRILNGASPLRVLIVYAPYAYVYDVKLVRILSILFPD